MRKSDLKDAFNPAPEGFENAVFDALKQTRRMAAEKDKKRRHTGIFRLPVLAAGLVCLLLAVGTAGTYALLNTGFNVMQRQENEYSTNKSMIVIGDTLYVNDGLSLRSYTPGDADSATVIDAIVRHVDVYYRDAVRQPLLKGKYFIDMMLDIDGRLCGLNLNSGLLFSIEWENGQGIYTDMMKLNLKNVKRGSDRKDYCQILSPVVQDDMLYFINWNEDAETRTLGAYSLTTGEGGAKKTRGIRELAPYRDGRLLAIAEFEQNGERAPWLCVYDPAEDALEQKLNLTPISDSVGLFMGLEYSPAKDCAYVTEESDGTVYCLPGLKSIEKNASISNFGWSYVPFGRCSALVRDTYYCTADLEGVYIRNVEAGYQSPLTVGCDGFSLDDDTMKAAARVSGVDADAVSVGLRDANGLQEMLLTRDDTYDIYVFSTDDFDLRVLLQKGYAPAAPEGLTALQEHFSALYPIVREAVSRQRNMCAVPVGISPLASCYDPEMLVRLGLHAPPADFLSLMDLARAWMAGELPGLELGDLLLPESLSRESLIDMALRQRVWECQARGEAVTLDNPGLRAVLAAIEGLDADALQSIFAFDEETLSDMGITMRPLLMLDADSSAVNETMHLLPFTLAGGDAVTPCGVTVAIVNPYGHRQAEAWEYLNAFVQALDDGEKTKLYPDWNDPIENPNYAAMAEDAQYLIDRAKGTENYEAYREDVLRDLEMNRWVLSAEDIRVFREIMTRAFVSAPSPLDAGTDAGQSFADLTKRYADGNITLDEFIARGDEMLSLMQKE